MPNSTEQSKAHRLFFIDVADHEAFSLPDYAVGDWDEKLGESSDAVLQRFIDEGLIEPAPLSFAIDSRFTKKHIATFLRERGLKIGGKKEEMVVRLIESDPAWAAEIENKYRFYQYTVAGREFAKTIAGEIGKENGELEARLLLLIHDGLHEEAYRVWQAWDAEQLEPLGNERNVDDVWRAENADDFVKMAQRISAILPPGVRDRFLVDWLMGERDFYERSLLTQQHGKAYERDLMDWRRSPSSVVGLRIVASPPPNCQCSFAKCYEGYYRLEDAPDHPFGPCDNEPCCLCGWECVFDDEAAGVAWRVPAKRHPLAGGRIEVPEEPITEERIRRLAEVMNGAGCGITEGDIQESLINSGLRKPKGLLERLRDWLQKLA